MDASTLLALFMTTLSWFMPVAHRKQSQEFVEMLWHTTLTDDLQCGFSCDNIPAAYHQQTDSIFGIVGSNMINGDPMAFIINLNTTEIRYRYFEVVGALFTFSYASNNAILVDDIMYFILINQNDCTYISTMDINTFKLNQTFMRVWNESYPSPSLTVASTNKLNLLFIVNGTSIVTVNLNTNAIAKSSILKYNRNGAVAVTQQDGNQIYLYIVGGGSPYIERLNVTLIDNSTEWEIKSLETANVNFNQIASQLSNCSHSTYDIHHTGKLHD